MAEEQGAGNNTAQSTTTEGGNTQQTQTVASNQPNLNNTRVANAATSPPATQPATPPATQPVQPPAGFVEGLKAMGINSMEEFTQMKEGYTQFKQQNQTPNVNTYGLPADPQATATNTPTPGQDQSPGFANPFVEKINKMFIEGKSNTDIAAFLRINSMDVDNMDPSTAVVERIKLEHPSLTPQEVDYYLEDKYGKIPAPGTEGYDEAVGRIQSRMKVDGLEAKNWLKDQMASFSDPEAEARRNQLAQQRQQLQASWGHHVSQMTTPENLKLSFKMQDDQMPGGKGYYFDFDVSKKLTAQQQVELNNMMVNYAIDENLPVNAASAPKLEAYRNSVLSQYFMNDYLTELVRDVHAAAWEAATKQFSVGQGGNTQQVRTNGSQTRVGTAQQTTNPPVQNPQPRRNQDRNKKSFM
jgi:hypothetical protein